MFKFLPPFAVKTSGRPRRPVPIEFSLLVLRTLFEIFLTMLARGAETFRNSLNVFVKSRKPRGAQDNPQAREPLNISSDIYRAVLRAAVAKHFAKDPEIAKAQLKRIVLSNIFVPGPRVEAVTPLDIDALGSEPDQAQPAAQPQPQPQPPAQPQPQPRSTHGGRRLLDSTEFAALFNEDFDPIEPARARKTTTGKTPRELQKLATHKQYRRWQKDYAKLKKENPGKTDSWISEQILKLEQKRFDENPAKTGRVRSVGTIVKNMKPCRK